MATTKPETKTEDEQIAEMIAAEEAAKKSETKPAPFAGKGDHDGDGKAGGTTKLFPVRILKGYRPAGDYRIIDLDGKPQPPPVISPEQDAGIAGKVKPGYLIMLPNAEAKTIIAAGIAVRADDIPD